MLPLTSKTCKVTTVASIFFFFSIEKGTYEWFTCLRKFTLNLAVSIKWPDAKFLKIYLNF